MYVSGNRTGLVLCVYVHVREGRRRSNSVYMSSACDFCMQVHTSAASLSRSTENLANIIQINFLMQIQVYAYLF